MSRVIRGKIAAAIGGILLLGAPFSLKPAAQAPSAGDQIASLQSQIAQNPGNAGLFISLAGAFYRAGRYDDAITAAKRANDITPSAQGYVIITVSCMAKGDTAAARVQLDKGLAIAPGDPTLSIQKGRLFLMGGQYEQAAETFAVISASVPAPSSAAQTASAPPSWASDAAWLEGLADYLAGRPDAAIKAVARLMALDQQGTIGIQLEYRTAPNKAVYLTVVSIAPGSQASRSDLRVGDWLRKIDGKKTFRFQFAGNQNVFPGMSQEDILAALAGHVGSTAELQICRGAHCPTVQVTRENLDSKEQATHFGLRALIMRAKGDKENALADSQKAVSLDPASFWSQVPYGLALMDTGRMDDALKAFESSGINTGYSVAEALRQTARALCYAKKGDMDRAAEVYFAAANDIDQRCLPCREVAGALLAMFAPMAQSHLEKAKKLEAEGKYADALPEYAQALRFAAGDKDAADLRGALFAAGSKMPTPPELPEDARVSVVRGETLIKDGDLAAAAKEFNDAIRLAPYMPKLYYNAALLNGQLKRYAEAIRLMNIYLQGAPDAPDARAAKDEIIKWKLEMERQEKK